MCVWKLYRRTDNRAFHYIGNVLRILYFKDTARSFNDLIKLNCEQFQIALYTDKAYIVCNILIDFFLLDDLWHPILW